MIHNQIVSLLQIRSVMEDLKTQVHEQFNQWSQEEDHRRKGSFYCTIIIDYVIL